MTNPFDQFTTQQQPGVTGNPFDSFLNSPTVDETEQEVISKVNNPRVESPRNFGFVEFPATIANEFNRSILNIPREIGATILETGELAQVEKNQTLAESFTKRLAKNLAEGDTGIGGLAQTIWGTEKDAILKLLPESAAPALVSAGRAIIDQNDAATNFLLGAPKNGFPADLGSGAASFLKSAGAWYIAKDPKAAGAYMALSVNSGDYQEARKVGKDPEEAALIAASSAHLQGKLEGIGMGVYTAALAGSSFFKKVLFRAAEQGIEETSQAAVEETVKGVSGVRNTSFGEKLTNVFYQGALGLIVGAPVSAVFTHMENTARDLGINPEDIKSNLDAFIKNRDDVVDGAAEILNREATGITKDEPMRAESLKAIQGVIAEQEKVDTAIAEGSTEDPKIAARVVLQSNINEEVKTAINALPEGFTMEELQKAIDDNKIAIKPILTPEQHIATLEQRMADIEQTLESLPPEQRKAAEKEMLTLSDAIKSIRDSKRPTNIYSDIDEKVARMTPEMRRVRLESLNRKLIAGIAPTTRELYEREALSFDPVQLTSLKPVENKSKRELFNRVLDAEKQSKRLTTEGGKQMLVDVKNALGKALTPISTRLRNINPKLAARLRQFEFGHNKQINADSAIAKPFLEKFHKLSREDKVIMDFAMKNGDMETINEIAAANNMTAEIEALRVMFDELYKRGKKVNLDIGYRKGFFPRLVENPKKLLAYFGKTEAWNDIQQAIKNKEMELGRILDDNEKAHLINTLLRGYQTAGITLAKPGALKERSIDQVTPEINEFYATTDQAILRYITTVNDAIETRNFLGKDAETIEDSIGAFVLRELEKGTLNPNQAQELSDILKARFHQGKMNPLLKAYKNLSYIDTMGSPISAITQLSGIGYSLSNNGFYRVLKSLPSAVADRSEITLQDIGVDRIAEEFSDGGTTGNAVRKVFKAVGLQKLDRMDKLTFINSTLLRFRDLAKKPTKEFRASLENIFEDETDQVISDLQNKVNSENVKLLLFNEILDMQPLTKSEMPEMYLSHPNGRIFYMLKSFTLKQYDIYRKQVFDEIRAGNRVKGLVNLTRLTAFFVMMNAGADFLKDLLLNRDTPPEDQVVNNIARIFGFSKYQVYSVRREGFGTAAFKTIAPPFKAVDSMSKDMAKAIEEGEVNMDDLETMQSVPIVGKFYYWWFGAGADK